MKKLMGGLSALKGRKIRKYEDGGEVFTDEPSSSVATAIEADVADGDLSPTDYVDLLAYLNSGNMDALEGIATPSFSANDLNSLLSEMGVSIDPQGAVVPQQLQIIEVPTQEPVKQVDLTGQQQAQPNITVAPVAAAPTQQVATPAAAGTGDKSPVGQQIKIGKDTYQQLGNQWVKVEPETDFFNWKNLIGLGLAGAGGLAAFKGAKDQNAAAKPFNDNALLQAQLETQFMQKMMGGGGLGSMGGGGGSVSFGPAAPTSGQGATSGGISTGRRPAPATTSFVGLKR